MKKIFWRLPSKIHTSLCVLSPCSQNLVMSWYCRLLYRCRHLSTWPYSLLLVVYSLVRLLFCLYTLSFVCLLVYRRFFPVQFLSQQRFSDGNSNQQGDQPNPPGFIFLVFDPWSPVSQTCNRSYLSNLPRTKNRFKKWNSSWHWRFSNPCICVEDFQVFYYLLCSPHSRHFRHKLTWHILYFLHKLEDRIKSLINRSLLFSVLFTFFVKQ